MASDLDKANCARRELTMRMRVYPRFVADGRMTQAEANREVALMTEIEMDYRNKAEPRLTLVTPSIAGCDP
jgi:hypothetical protein